MENFYEIHSCPKTKFRVFLNGSNQDVLKKFGIINRDEKLLNKFVLVLEAVKKNVATKSQYNWEDTSDLGEIFAIKVNEHRFYTLQCSNDGYRELYICRYGRKQSQQNTKKLTTTIKSISKISIQKLLT